MRFKLYSVLLLGALSIFSNHESVGSIRWLVTEVLNEKEELAKPILVFLMPLEKSIMYRKEFTIQYSGKYKVELFTQLKDDNVKRYELPDINSNLKGEISIHGNAGEFLNHTFDVDLQPTIIGKGLFGTSAPKTLPLEESLTFEIVLTEISDSFLELYSSVTIIVKRQGVLYH